MMKIMGKRSVELLLRFAGREKYFYQGNWLFVWEERENLKIAAAILVCDEMKGKREVLSQVDACFFFSYLNVKLNKLNN